MSELDPNSAQPEPEISSPNEPVPAPDPTPTASPKSRFSLKLVLIIVGLIVAGGVTLAAVVVKNNSQNRNDAVSSQAGDGSALKKTQPVKQVFVNPVDGTKTTISKTEFYAVTISSNEYYGRVSKINNDFIRMTPTAYKNAGVLTFTGKELHGPEPIAYFRVAKITKFQPVADAAITNALQHSSASASDAYPSTDITKYLQSGRIQAFFFTNGSVYFTKAITLDGNFLADGGNVYFLTTAKANSPAGMNTATSLQVAKPEQYAKLTAADLLYWQNTKVDSKISQAISDYERQTPGN